MRGLFQLNKEDLLLPGARVSRNMTTFAQSIRGNPFSFFALSWKRSICIAWFVQASAETNKLLPNVVFRNLLISRVGCLKLLLLLFLLLFWIWVSWTLIALASNDARLDVVSFLNLTISILCLCICKLQSANIILFISNSQIIIFTYNTLRGHLFTNLVAVFLNIQKKTNPNRKSALIDDQSMKNKSSEHVLMQFKKYI